MQETLEVRFSKALKEFNVGIDQVIAFLATKGQKIDRNPNAKISGEAYNLLLNEYGSDKKAKVDSKKQESILKPKKDVIVEKPKVVESEPKVVPETVKSIAPIPISEPIKVELRKVDAPQRVANLKVTNSITDHRVVESKSNVKLEGPKVLGKIDLSTINSKIKPNRKTKENEELIAKVTSKKTEKEVVEEVNMLSTAQSPTEIERPEGQPNLGKLEQPLVHGANEKVDIQKQIIHLENKENLQKLVSESGIKEEVFKKYLSLLENKKQIILQGAPGTGKSYTAEILAKHITENDLEAIYTVQFHQSYSYEEFIEGIRLNHKGGGGIKSGIFKEFCEKAHKSLDKKFVFIIDEINRGNVSKIFGEILLLIENRNKPIKLACSKTNFFIPENVYMIGTMNTSDRSIAFVDFAMRRRFKFITLEPDYDILKYHLIEKKCKLEIEQFISNIQSLNKKISNYPSLGKSFELGISYFIKDFDFSRLHLNDIWEYELCPLFEEYFSDDLSEVKKLQTVLFKGIHADTTN